jgi:hypothetical protein
MVAKCSHPDVRGLVLFRANRRVFSLARCSKNILRETSFEVNLVECCTYKIGNTDEVSEVVVINTGEPLCLVRAVGIMGVVAAWRDGDISFTEGAGQLVFRSRVTISVPTLVRPPIRFPR